MTNRRYSERTLTPSTNPLTGMALIGVSTTNDGGLTYNASIKATFDEFVEWLLDNGIPIDDDLIVVGTGTGIEGSTGKAGGVAGYPNDFILAHKDHHSVTNYMSWQEETGNVYHNVPEGNTMYIIAGGSTLLKLRDGDDEGLQICHQDTKKVVIGNTLESFDSIAKLHIRGAGNDILTLSAEGAAIGAFCFTVGQDEKVTLKNGVGVNEISDDSDFSSATNDEVRTALAIKDFVEGLVTPQIIGGVTLSSSSNTNILNGTYVILADTTTVTSVTSGISQDSNWTLEITQAGITNQKGVVTFTGNLEKDGGGGANYDVAIFKNGSIVSESEQIDHKLESDGKGQSVTVMAIIEFSTSDTFDIRVSGNGTANDIFCGGGSLYIQ